MKLLINTAIEEYEKDMKKLLKQSHEFMWQVLT